METQDVDVVTRFLADNSYERCTNETPVEVRARIRTVTASTSASQATLFNAAELMIDIRSLRMCHVVTWHVRTSALIIRPLKTDHTITWYMIRLSPRPKTTITAPTIRASTSRVIDGTSYSK